MSKTRERISPRLKGGLEEVFNLIKALSNRGIGAIDFFLALLGIMPRNSLRLRIAVLRDVTNTPVASNSVIHPILEYTMSIFSEQANVDILAADGLFMETLVSPAPTSALEVGCDADAWLEDFGEAGDFFRLNSAQDIASRVFGHAVPVTAFIVRNIREGKTGCSLGPLTDYVVIGLQGLENSNANELSLVPSKVLAHEIAHACGLWHGDYGMSNLINPSPDSATRLTRFQKAVLRNSRHVTYA